MAREVAVNSGVKWSSNCARRAFLTSTDKAAVKAHCPKGCDPDHTTVERPDGAG
jgi:hypothetical protein